MYRAPTKTYVVGRGGHWAANHKAVDPTLEQRGWGTRKIKSQKQIPQRRPDTRRPRNDKLAVEARFTKWDMAHEEECIERWERERHKGRQTHCEKRSAAIFLKED